MRLLDEVNIGNIVTVSVWLLSLLSYLIVFILYLFVFFMVCIFTYMGLQLLRVLT